MRPQDLRALHARMRSVRPPTPWLLIGLDWLVQQVRKAPRPLRMPLLILIMAAAELLPVRLLAFQEALNDQLYPDPAQS